MLTKRQSINKVLVRHHYEEFVIADVENDMLTDLKNIFGLFKQSTDIFQTDIQASLPRVIPTLRQLERAMISFECGHASISAVRETSQRTAVTIRIFSLYWSVFSLLQPRSIQTCN